LTCTGRSPCRCWWPYTVYSIIRTLQRGQDGRSIAELDARQEYRVHALNLNIGNDCPSEVLPSSKSENLHSQSVLVILYRSQAFVHATYPMVLDNITLLMPLTFQVCLHRLPLEFYGYEHPSSKHLEDILMQSSPWRTLRPCVRSPLEVD